MSIRLKLLISNILMIIIPLISAIVLAIILIGAGFHESGWKHSKSAKINEKHLQDTFKEFITISNNALNNPDKLLDLKYIESIDSKLKALNSGIGFVVSNKIYYLNTDIDREKFQKALDAKDVDEAFNKISKTSENLDIHHLKYDLKLSTGENCALFIFFDMTPLKKFVGTFMSDFTLYFLIIIIITNVILTFFVSQSIIRPLKKLKYGAQQIKNGNLNFVIDEKSNDEVGQVCNAFEEMRHRLKDALTEQLKYDEERNEFIANITHDLRTPITSIKGHIEGLRDGVADTPEKSSKYIDIIYKKTIDMDRLINDLTFYSNQAFKKVSYNFSRLNLKLFIDDMVDEYNLEFEKMGIKITTSSGLGNNTFVKADAEKLKRVVTNIFDNAIKYMDKENGQLNIEVTDMHNNVLIGIHDNGEGIKKEALPNIFNRFYRADASRNTSKGGSGLGLAIASQIIKEHGGSIWAESEPGKGTSIYFELEKTGENNEKTDIDN